MFTNSRHKTVLTARPSDWVVAYGRWWPAVRWFCVIAGWRAAAKSSVRPSVTLGSDFAINAALQSRSLAVAARIVTDNVQPIVTRAPVFTQRPTITLAAPQ